MVELRKAEAILGGHFPLHIGLASHHRDQILAAIHQAQREAIEAAAKVAASRWCAKPGTYQMYRCTDLAAAIRATLPENRNGE